MERRFRDSHADKVVRLADRGRRPRFAAAAEVEAYWEALRGDRPMPDRGEIDPRGIEGALPHAVLLEPVAPGIARFRVAGTGLYRIMGMDVRGMPLSAFFLPEAREVLADTVRRVAGAPAAATLTLRSPGRMGRAALDARLWLAPVRCPRLDTVRLLGCLEPEGDIGLAPRRFAIEHVRLRATAEPDTQSRKGTGSPSGAPQRKSSAGRPALRLVPSPA